MLSQLLGRLNIEPSNLLEEDLTNVVNDKVLRMFHSPRNQQFFEIFEVVMHGAALKEREDVRQSPVGHLDLVLHLR